VENPGGTLEFQLEGTENEVTSILMTGPAEKLAEYEI
jgi:diaminopimelate epimerase